ncbi:MAG TPA: hypothetical protein PLU88_09810, partial [Armatimonadota bacterium]|nr:hypothetical protein [Armatimonadota bacterium]
TRPDAYKRTIDPWRGYWIRSFVNCTLVLTAPGGTVSALSLSPEEAGPGLVRSSALPALDEPPPAPTGAGK